MNIAALWCPDCKSGLDAAALSCPNCHRLTHASELERLAQQARAAAARGRVTDERTAWRQALALLPDDTVQYRTVQARLEELESIPERHPSGWKKALVALGPAAFLAWKFKAVLLFLLTKGKLLLLGLTKGGTLLTMFASLGVYWAMYGWAFAVGLILSIYIHEMGHVAALRRLGIPAGAPMFIPGFDAFIRLRALNLDPVADARIGLAGPLYGLGAAIACLAAYYTTGGKFWAVIAHFGAVINLFNLIPVWQLDGARGVHSQTRKHRGWLLATAALLWFLTSNGMFLLVAAGLTYRMFTKDSATEPDLNGFLYYAGLMVALAIVLMLAPLH